MEAPPRCTDTKDNTIAHKVEDSGGGAQTVEEALSISSTWTSLLPSCP